MVHDPGDEHRDDPGPEDDQESRRVDWLLERIGDNRLPLIWMNIGVRPDRIDLDRAMKDDAGP